MLGIWRYRMRPMSARAAERCEAAQRSAAGLIGCFARPARAAAEILTLQLASFYERRFRARYILSFRKLVHQRTQALVFDLQFLHVAKRFRCQAAITFAPTIERSQRDMGRAANFSNRNAGIGFVEKE